MPPAASTAASAARPHTAGSSGVYRSAGTYTVCTGWRDPSSPGYAAGEQLVGRGEAGVDRGEVGFGSTVRILIPAARKREG